MYYYLNKNNDKFVFKLRGYIIRINSTSKISYSLNNKFEFQILLTPKVNWIYKILLYKKYGFQ